MLSLPSEIRACIWKYVLGRKVFLVLSSEGGSHLTYFAYMSYKFAPSPALPKHGMALLRTCRQTYSEAVLYPLNMSTFACGNSAELKRAVRTLRTYQRKQVMHLRLDCATHNHIGWIDDRAFSLDKLYLEKRFPALAQITVLIYGVTDTEHDAFESAAATLLSQLHQTLEVTGAELAVEGIPDKMRPDRANGK